MKLSEQVQKIQDQQARLEAEKSALESLAASLKPDFPDPARVIWFHSKLNEYRICYDVDTLPEALELVKAIWNMAEVPPAYLLKNGCTSFRTIAHKPETGTQTPVYPLTVKVSKWDMVLEFYIVINDQLVSVDIKVKNFFQHAHVSFYQYRPHTKVERVHLEAPSFRDYQFIKWWSTRDEPNDFTMYWTNIKSLDDILKE